ncbi:hypothetical protein YTPLAS72_13970 [Nitrospira sp.]|nr:hypothetical protein YTPLAS72_13970 [Nitrospira sp.]
MRDQELDVRRRLRQCWTNSVWLLSLMMGCTGSLFPSYLLFAQGPISAPPEIHVFDTPNDGGGSLTVEWAPAAWDGPDVRYQVLVGDASSTDPSTFTVMAEFPANTKYLKDTETAWWTRDVDKSWHYLVVRSTKGLEIKDGTSYAVSVATMRDDQRLFTPVIVATPSPDWFNWNQLNNLIIAVSFGGLIFYTISHAKRNNIFLRRIPGLDAVDEAIGRATELGKPVLYLTGAHDLHDPSTVAAAVILGKVAKRAALYETELMVPHREPITMAVCQEITKQAYLEAGKPDLFKEDANFFITSDQFSYAAAVDGIMLRKKPAANFFMGHYFAESLLLTETGASTGAIQIAGTDADHQLPFFVTTCDYTLIGEELYAASAYLSKEPVQIGTLRGQDIGKAVILTAIAVGTVLATFGAVTGAEWPQIMLDFLSDVK